MASVTRESLENNPVLAGETQPITEKVTVLTGQTLTAGSVVGLVTASGKAKLLDSASADGSEAFYGVLMDDVDASAADVEAMVYIKAHVRSDRLTLGGSTTVADIKADARTNGIYIS